MARKSKPTDAPGGKSREEVLETIRNLMRMTTENGCTENEASNAAAAAQAMVLKYQVETHELEIKEGADLSFNVKDWRFKADCENQELKFDFNWRLARAVSQMMGVILFKSPSGHRYGYGSRIGVIGDEIDAEVAANLYKAIWTGAAKEEQKAWKTRKGTERDGLSRWKHLASYLDGYFFTIQEMTKRSQEKAVKELMGEGEANVTAIIAVKDALVKDYSDSKMNWSKRKSNYGGGDRDPDAWAKGRADGKNSDLGGRSKLS